MSFSDIELYTPSQLVLESNCGGADKLELTKRELEILNLLADGLNSKQIAKNLFLSIHTIDTHRKNLHSKFNIVNVAALISQAFRKGIIH